MPETFSSVALLPTTVRQPIVTVCSDGVVRPNFGPREVVEAPADVEDEFNKGVFSHLTAMLLFNANVVYRVELHGRSQSPHQGFG